MNTERPTPSSSSENRRSRVLPPLPTTASPTFTPTTSPVENESDPGFDPPSRLPSYRGSMPPQIPSTPPPPPSPPTTQHTHTPPIPLSPPPSIPMTPLSEPEIISMTLNPTLSLVTTTTETLTDTHVMPDRRNKVTTTTVKTTTVTSTVSGNHIVHPVSTSSDVPPQDEEAPEQPPARSVPSIPPHRPPPPLDPPPPVGPPPPLDLPPVGPPPPLDLPPSFDIPRSPRKSESAPTEFEVLHNLYLVQYETVLEYIKKNDDKLTKGNPTRLPPDLWHRILHYLTPSEILQIMLTCKFFRTLTEHEQIWQNFYHFYNPSIMDAVLDKSERSWKLKFKYETSIISKAGMVDRRSGVLWSVWAPIWLALSGVHVYIFASIDNIRDREPYLKQISREGLPKLLAEFQPTSVINLKSAQILSASAKGGKQRFGFRTGAGEVYFNAPTTVAAGWIKILLARVESLTNDFSVRPFSPSNY